MRDVRSKGSGATARVKEEVALDDYSSLAPAWSYTSDPENLPEEMRQTMLQSGVMLDQREGRSGTFVQVDHTPVHVSAAQDGIELMAVQAALAKYDWLSDYWWSAESPDTDRFTSHVDNSEVSGYFIRALPSQKTILPLQACLYLETEGLAQSVHNVVIAEEDSELHIITGCASGPQTATGLHLGITEFFVRKGARLTFTMIHNWQPGIVVRPRTGVVLEEGATFISNYVIMKPVKDLQTDPRARCIGPNSTVRFNSVVAGFPGGKIDIGSRVFLSAPGSRAEIISRAIATGGEIIARGFIEGSAPDVKGHLECRGLILNDGGVIHAVPELRGTVAGIDLYHEAAVGKLAEEEVEYLMARGLSHDEAASTIVRGFLHVEIEGLPDVLNQELQRAIEASENELM